MHLWMHRPSQIAIVVAAFLLFAAACTSADDAVSAGATDAGAPSSEDAQPALPDVGQQEAGVDTSCVDLRMLERRSVAPSGLGLFVSVDNCQGDPVTDLPGSRFQVLEDSVPLGVEANVTPVPLKGQEIFVTVLFDRSTSTASYFPGLQAAAQTFVDKMAASGVRVQIGVTAFAGEAAPTVIQAPTLDSALVKSKIAELSTFVPQDPSSSNVNGAVASSVTALGQSTAAFRARNFGGAFTAEYVLVFTDGADTAKRVTLEAASATVAKTPATVIGVAMGASFDPTAKAALQKLAWAGVLDGSDPTKTTAAFDFLATRMQGQFRRTYLVGYCSPARAGTHTVEVRLTAPSQTRTPATSQFSAIGFGPGCSGASFGTCDGGKTCGGLGCGACDDRTGACSPSTSACVNFCAAPPKRCGGATITNERGYVQTCADIPESTKCGTTCRDITTDLANCGMCDKACAVGGSCAAAACTCPNAEVACSGKCTNTSSDPAHCGTCAIACPSLGTCTGGACACPQGLAICGTACVNLLNDVNHCGSCDNKCEACSEGRCMTTITTGTAMRGVLLQDTSTLYFADGSQVRAVSKSGGATRVLVSTTQNPGTVAVDASYLYWIEPKVSGGGAVYRIPTLGGTATEVFAHPTDVPTALALDDLSVYVVYGLSTSTIARVPMAGGASTIVGSVPRIKRGITANAGYLYWWDSIPSVPASNGTLDAVFRISAAGGTASTWTSDASQAPRSSSASTYGAPISFDATNGYWYPASGPTRFGLAAPGAGTLLDARYEAGLKSLAVDGTNLYEVNGNVNLGPVAIRKVPTNGSAPSAVIFPLTANVTSSLLVDNSAIYFVDTQQRIRRIAPK